MGYDVERFVSDVNEGLLCCICRDVLEDPLQAASCEHAFCSACIRGWLVQESVCPEDRQVLIESELRPLYRYMRNDLQRLELRCVNATRGCSEVTTMERMKAHDMVCPCGVVRCPNLGCKASLPRKDMPQHTATCEHKCVSVTAGQSPLACAQSCTAIDRDDSLRAVQMMKKELKSRMAGMAEEMFQKITEQRQEFDQRLDAQRRHLVQRETNLQYQIDELRSQNVKLLQEVKKLSENSRNERRMSAKPGEIHQASGPIHKSQTAYGRLNSLCPGCAPPKDRKYPH